MEPFDVSEVYHKDVSFTSNVDEIVMSGNVIEILNKHVPSYFRADYRRFVEGVSLPKNRREKIIVLIKSLLKEHWSEDEDWKT